MKKTWLRILLKILLVYFIACACAVRDYFRDRTRRGLVDGAPEAGVVTELPEFKQLLRLPDHLLNAPAGIFPRAVIA